MCLRGWRTRVFRDAAVSSACGPTSAVLAPSWGLLGRRHSSVPGVESLSALRLFADANFNQKRGGRHTCPHVGLEVPAHISCRSSAPARVRPAAGATHPYALVTCTDFRVWNSSYFKLPFRLKKINLIQAHFPLLTQWRGPQRPPPRAFLLPGPAPGRGAAAPEGAAGGRTDPRSSAGARLTGLQTRPGCGSEGHIGPVSPSRASRLPPLT